MAKLTGKVALVTGGGSGIGAASAKALAEEGAKVVIVGRNLATLDKTVRAIGHGVLHYLCDVSEQKKVAALVQRITEKQGPIDILVNNAGTNLKERTFRELTPEAWDRLIRTNLDGAFYCIHAVFPAMLARKDGVIINIVSIAGKRASPLGGVAYAASKFGQAALGMGLGGEVMESGIRVCNIYPGEVDTPILVHRPQPLTEEHRARILRPEDVAEAVRYVATQPKHVSIPELIIKPASQMYV
jgi:NADP-dependent 3-hydroxy acid dehydrogenase YdfG